MSRGLEEHRIPPTLLIAATFDDAASKYKISTYCNIALFQAAFPQAPPILRATPSSSIATSPDNPPTPYLSFGWATLPHYSLFAIIMLSLTNKMQSGAAVRRNAFTAAAQPVAIRPTRVQLGRRQSVPVVCAVAAAEAETKSGVAKLRFQRGSVFKVRRVLDTIRGESYENALILMEYMPYRACEKIIKALMSAAANAKHNQSASKSKLYVSEAMADQGPMYKRFTERAQGRAFRINKPTFHLEIKLEERA